MSSFFKCFFWWLLPAPKVGEQWRHYESGDPWWENNTPYLILERKRNWYRVQFDGLPPESKHRSNLVAFYRRVE